jgi:hypothetical protein
MASGIVHDLVSALATTPYRGSRAAVLEASVYSVWCVSAVLVCIRSTVY